ncbi:MAG: M56 family metallopeptidase [Salinivirgaceae bacterium]|nr:M56 family metallopeptidase [Salinivirgaceae bacterium]
MEAIVYSLKVSVFLIAFYLMFKSLMSRETLHRANRFLILGTMVLSFALPFCHLTVSADSPAVVSRSVSQSVVMLEEVIVGGGAARAIDWRTVAVMAFYAGIVACFVRMIVSIIGVLRIVRRGQRQQLDDGSVLVVVDGEQAPFSWVKYIIISRKDHDENLQQVLTHEQAHIRYRHSIDLLVCDVLCCLQWFNPAMWLLRQELCAIHEYEADKAVLDSGVNAKQYQILLIKKAAGGKWYSIANSLNHSKLKYRITMMSRKKSSGWTLVKALYVLPIAAFAAIAFANCSKTEGEITKNPDSQNLEKMPADQYNQILELTGGNIPNEGILLAVDRVDDETGEESHLSLSMVMSDGTVRPVSQEELEAMTVPDDGQVVEGAFVFEPDVKPEFPGGELEMRKYIANHIVYPEYAKKNRIEGTVIVSFDVDHKGNVSGVGIVKSVHESLDNAAIEVIKSMPKWSPALYHNTKVRTSFDIPINFKLD